MPFAEDLFARLNEWGKAAFEQELQNGFARARIFDGQWVQIEFDALRQFSTEELQLLGNILRVRDAEFEKSLAGRERQLLDTFHAATRQLVLNRREKFIEQAMLNCQKPVRQEGAKIKKMAPGIFKDVAKHCECEIRRADTSVWRLSRLERWGEISMFFDLHEAMEFSYYFDIEDNDYRPVLKREGYLRRIGIPSSSSCRLTDADMFAEKIAKVAEIIEGQLNDYAQIIESLDWPR